MIVPYEGKMPRISSRAFIIGDPFISGMVVLEDYASIWPGVSARGDVNRILIGAYSNIQDNCTLHCEHDQPQTIGSRVTVGHGAILHGCTIGDLCLVGIGAVVLNGAVVPEKCMIGAGSLVPQGKHLEPGKLYLGSPARAVRALTDQEIDFLFQSSEHYVKYAKKYCPGE